MSLACGIDVGGTKIAGGVVDEDGTIIEELRVESPATDAEAIEEAIAGLVTQLRARHPIETDGVGAEIGHMRVVPNGILCGCGKHGCFEQYASGSALVREARALAMSGAMIAR